MPETEFQELVQELRGLCAELRESLGNRVSARTQEHYSVEEVARQLGKAPFTVRQWCNKGRLRGAKTTNGREWVVGRDEIERYRKEGLLPEAGE